MTQLQAGRFQHRITIRRPVRTKDAAGQPVQGTPTVLWANVPADVVSLSGVEIVAGEQVRGLATQRVFIRYRAGVTAQDEILWGARVLGIVSVRDAENNGRLLTIDCLEAA